MHEAKSCKVIIFRIMKSVVIGITGSIAAYKAAEIVSQLKKKGIDINVIMTKAGSEFITPLTLETLSKNPVVTDMFNRNHPWEVEHIALAKKADVFLVAPASADFISKAANGICDDMLTTTILATRAEILIAPAMNDNMYLNPIIQENIAKLKSRGYKFIDPESGMLACGTSGVGRLADVNVIVQKVVKLLNKKDDLKGKKVLVTAGPTCEDIDPVRYITNRSTGKMGYAVARAAAMRGAEVTLISGKTNLTAPQGVNIINIRSSQNMFDEVNNNFDCCDMLIMAAAPADFTPVKTESEKVKKNGKETLTIELVATKDILASVGVRKGNRVIVGFAAETQNIENNAKPKLEKKNLDMIAANDVKAEKTGFGYDTNAITLYSKNGTVKNSGLMSKDEVADWLLDEAIHYLN